MKRLLFLLTCLLLLTLPALAEDNAPYVGVWIETEGEGTLTIRLDGSATMVYNDGWVMDTTWAPTESGAAFGKGMWYNSPMTLLDENTLSVSDGWMVFTREGFLPTADEALLLGATPVGDEGAPFLGVWNLVSLVLDGETVDPALFSMSMTLTFNADGTVLSDDGWDSYTTTWAVSDGSAVVDGDILTIGEDGRLVCHASDGQMIFAPAEVAPAPSDEPTEEDQLLALLSLLSLLAQTEEGDLSALPEEHQPFVGEWHLCYAENGGLTGDLRTLGLTGTLTLRADYTGTLSGIADEEGSWYDDEGVLRFGESGMPMFLVGEEADGMGLFLQYGSQQGGYMLFHQDEEAVWTPGLYPLHGAAAEPTPAPAASAPAGLPGGDAQEHLNRRFRCTSYTAAGYTLDASALGMEYALLFRDDGTADFTMAGVAIPNLPYTVTDEGVYSINYFGTLFNCTPTEAGFDMDFYGTMIMHFVPAE